MGKATNILVNKFSSVTEKWRRAELVVDSKLLDSEQFRIFSTGKKNKTKHHFNKIH
jgi:hypothetical protein